MVIPPPLLTIAGGQAAAQPTPPSAVAPQLIASFKAPTQPSAPTQPTTTAQASQPVKPDAAIAVEWAARSQESSPGAVLKLGSQGDAVTRLQSRLARLGYVVAKIDGIFGPKTQAMVMHFQQAYGLTADGIVDSSNWAVLNREITRSGQIQPLAPAAAIPADTRPTLPSPVARTASSVITVARADASQKTTWIVVLVVIQGCGWLAILQGLKQDIMLVTGRFYAGKTRRSFSR